MTVSRMSKNLNRHHFRHRSDTSAEIFDDTDTFFLLPANSSNLNQQQSNTIPSTHSSLNETIDETDTKKLLTAVDRLNKKISRAKNAINREQLQRDDNVKEYLDVSSKSDKQQLARIKALFEKKNQKSAHNIAHLQKKLENYQTKLQEIEANGGNAKFQNFRPTRDVLRDVGQGLKNVGGNIRDGITGFSGSMMSKQREFAHLIKNKFGSADNINEISTWYVDTSSPSTTTTATIRPSTSIIHNTDTERRFQGSSTLPANISQSFIKKFPSEEDSECSSMTSESAIGHREDDTNINQDINITNLYNMKTIFLELQERKYDVDKLKEELENYKNIGKEMQLLNNALQEERFRIEHLEEQINDLTELHQNEVENLKQGLIDMEEKVQYQSEERLRDIHEILDGVQTKVAKLEHLTLQQQQYVSLEGLDNSNARVVVVKLINIVLTLLQVVLLLVATFAGILLPFLRTRVRFVTTIIIALLVFFVIKQWPEFCDISSHIVYHLKRFLAPDK